MILQFIQNLLDVFFFCFKRIVFDVYDIHENHQNHKKESNS